MNRRQNRQAHKQAKPAERITTMKLTVPERIVLRSILPTQESYAGMTEIAKLKIHLTFSGEEALQIELTQEGGNLRWNADKAAQLIKDVPMGEWMTNVVRDILREKNEKHKLPEQEMSLYEKFIVDYGMV